MKIHLFAWNVVFVHCADGPLHPGASERQISLPKPKLQLTGPRTLETFVEGHGKRPKTSNARFTKEQIEFLVWAFNGGDTTNGRKIKQTEARLEMQKKFTATSQNDPYSSRLVLDEGQIVSWFSSRRAQLKEQMAREERERVVRATSAEHVVINRAFTEVSVAHELGQEEEGDGEHVGIVGGGNQDGGGDRDCR